MSSIPPPPREGFSPGLRDLCQRLGEAGVLRDGLEAVAWCCDGLFPFYRVALVLPARQPGQLHVAAAWARRAEEELSGYGFELRGHPLAPVLAAGAPAVRRDPQGDHPDSPLAALYVGEGKVEELILPLPLGGARGALVFASRERDGFAERHFPWLEDVARLVAVWVRPWAGHEASYVLERQYQALLDGALDGIVVLEGDEITYANASFREIFGVHSETAELGSFADWLHPDSLEAFSDARAWLERKPRLLPRLEMVGRNASGAPLQLELGMQSIMYLGEEALLVQVHNISERVERERGTRDAAARTDALLHALAHDIRGPLTSVIGFSELLLDRDEGLTEEQRREALQVMHRSSQGVRHLLESLLEYSALGADTAPVETVAIGPLLDQVESELAGDVQTTGAVIEYRRIPPHVCGRPVEISRVFRNLLHNAIKHRHAGSVPQIRVSGTGEEGGHWVFCVADNGIGVDPARASEIFQLFCKGSGGGAGVGLAIAERVVRGGGGRIWVEAATGGGSRFYFTLPKVGAEKA